MESPLLTLPGAVPADPPDEGVAWHYGDPVKEQRALAAGEGFVDLSHREVVRVSGPDRLGWLHLLTTQHMEQLAPHQASLALILSAQGRVEHQMALVDDGTATTMHVEPGTAAALVEYLDMMQFRSDVEVADVTAELAVVWEPVTATDAPYLARVTGRGRELFVPRAELSAYAAERGSPAGVWAYEALRIAAHEPSFGRETDHKTIPHEVGWINTAVHMDKGCYRGQETVAKVYNTGHPPRRLAFLHLDGSVETLPAHGDPVEHDGRDVGIVTSAARHHELGPIALALLKRTVPVDAALVAGGVAAGQEVVVSPDSGLHLRPRQLLG